MKFCLLSLCAGANMEGDETQGCTCAQDSTLTEAVRMVLWLSRIAWMAQSARITCFFSESEKPAGWPAELVWPRIGSWYQFNMHDFQTDPCIYKGALDISQAGRQASLVLLHFKTKCAIPDDIAWQQRLAALVTSHSACNMRSDSSILCKHDKYLISIATCAYVLNIYMCICTQLLHVHMYSIATCAYVPACRMHDFPYMYISTITMSYMCAMHLFI